MIIAPLMYCKAFTDCISFNFMSLVFSASPWWMSAESCRTSSGTRPWCPTCQSQPGKPLFWWGRYLWSPAPGERDKPRSYYATLCQLFLILIKLLELCVFLSNIWTHVRSECLWLWLWKRTRSEDTWDLLQWNTFTVTHFSRRTMCSGYMLQWSSIEYLPSLICTIVLQRTQTCSSCTSLYRKQNIFHH